MAEAGLVGSSYQQASLPWDAQRTVNLYPLMDDGGKVVKALYGTPGLALFGSAGQGPGRSAFTSDANGRAFDISGAGFYEVNGDGSTTLRGSLDQTQGVCTLAENGFQLAICDQVNLYIFTYATNAFQKVVTANLPSAYSVCFIDGYFIINRSPNSGIFQISNLYNGLVWNALDFATAESSPDSLLRVLNVSGQLWLQGTVSTEIYSNTGAASFPFTRISGAKIETGTIAPFASLSLDNSLFWINRDSNGIGIVFRAQGTRPQRISTEPIELRLQAAPDPSTLRSYSRQIAGHLVYSITGGGMETTLNYDITTQQWFETAYLNEDGNYELHLVADSFYAFNKHLGIDRRNGNIYEISADYYSDNGDEIASDRIFTHLFDENQRFKIKNFTAGFETGVGTQTGADDSVDPQVVLYISRDGGKTWSAGRMMPLARAGKFLARVKWDRLGQARQITFRLRITSPVKRAINGSWFNTL